MPRSITCAAPSRCAEFVKRGRREKRGGEEEEERKREGVEKK
jgi:hypothetical protein